MLIPVVFTGGSYKHKSLPLSAQRTINWWSQKTDNERGYSQEILTTFPGLLLFGTTAAGSDRGTFAHKGVLYRVAGTSLFSVSSAGTHTTLGTIPGIGRCIMFGILDSVVVVTGGVAYEWDGSTLTTGTDSDFESPNSGCHLNNQAIYDGDGGRFIVSDVGKPLDLSSLNYATAESHADDIVRVYSKNQILLLMGTERIEPWWNSGDGTPPFDRVESGIIEVGLGALHSVGENDTVLYFYGSDDQVYVLQGYNAVVVSTDAMAREFKTYGTRDDAIGFCMTISGKKFYILTFPTEGRTWAYQEGGEWFELSSGAEGGRWIVNSQAYCYGKNILADYRNGDLYELSDTTYTENGSTIIRTRDSAPIHGGLLNNKYSAHDGKWLEMNRFELFMETGIGLVSGQGSEPVVMLSFSDDGGKTWSAEMWGEVGAGGQYQWKVQWSCLGGFYNRIMRIRVSDPVPFTIFSGAAEVEVGI